MRFLCHREWAIILTTHNGDATSNNSCSVIAYVNITNNTSNNIPSCITDINEGCGINGGSVGNGRTQASNDNISITENTDLDQT